MGWVYLDDHWDEHPKLVAAYQATPRALVLFFASLAMSRRSALDGLIMAPKARGLLGWSPAAARALVDFGLWETLPNGAYSIHDYGEWNIERSPLRSASARNAAHVRWARNRRQDE